MTSSIIGIASRMVGWREQRVLKRLRVTPLATWEFVAANVISQMIIVLAQVLILTGLATPSSAYIWPAVCGWPSVWPSWEDWAS